MSSAFTYRFHTAILAVNRQIHEEASETLRSNKFILISPVWPGLSIFKHQIGLPIVMENQTHGAAFKSHALRVHLQASSSSLRYAGMENAKPASFLMVSHELQSLCFLFKYLYTACETSAQQVTHRGGNQASNLHLSKKPYAKLANPTLKIFVQDEAMSSKSIKSLLEPFRTVSFGMQNVKVLDIGNELQGYAQDLKHKMAPRSVWTKAQAWDWFEIIRELKAQGDQYVNVGDLASAEMRYGFVLRFAMGPAIHSVQREAYTPETSKIMKMIDCVILMCAVAENAVQIAREALDATRFRATMTLLGKMVGHFQSLPGKVEDTSDLVKPLQWLML